MTDRIMIFGPKDDGTYVVEFRHFHERMPYGLYVPDEYRKALADDRAD